MNKDPNQMIQVLLISWAILVMVIKSIRKNQTILVCDTIRFVYIAITLDDPGRVNKADIHKNYELGWVGQMAQC